MIKFEHHYLSNGLQVILAPQENRSLIASSLLYRVGSRNDPKGRTGFAHLFEHLMFAGGQSVDNFDERLQAAGGDSNAFTSRDTTVYFNMVPSENLDTALWLESDRMRGLKFSQKILETQQRVVVEEFKETCLEEPYGDAEHHLYGLAFDQHPYRHPVIGEDFFQIESAQLEEVKTFFYQYYRPNNAVLCLCGGFDPEIALNKVRNYFGDIPSGPVDFEAIPQELPQKVHKRKTVFGEVPSPALYFGYRSVGRLHPDFHALSVLSFLLGGGKSSLLRRRLMREQEIFHSLSVGMSNSFDPDLFQIIGVPAEDVDHERARNLLLQTIEQVKQEGIPKQEMQKVINRLEIINYYNDVSLDSRAEELCFFAALGRPEMINEEYELFKSISIDDLNRCLHHYLDLNHCSELTYLPDQDATISAEAN
ncbi:MAG: pitrilysin family protein [Bacteroidota bacterium]